MTFEQILLLVGAALLLLVILFALLGFFAGLRKELRCAAIAFVLILLAFLVFGDSSTILNADGSALKGVLTGVPESAKTVWDCILGYARANVSGGEELFVDGSKSYALLYDVSAGVCRGIGIIVGTIGMMVIILIANGLYRLISRIVRSNKKKKAGNKPEEAPANGAVRNTVLVSKNDESGATPSAAVTLNANEENKKKSLHRGWGAFVGALRAFIIIFILFTPISGICAILNEVTPETEQMIKDELNGVNSNTSETDDYIDMAMEFKDAYYASAVGKVVEKSGFFFGESWSTKMFDSVVRFDTDTESVPLRGEIITVVHALNALEGNSNYKALTDEQLDGLAEELKKSKLVPLIVPVAIEYGYYQEVNVNGSVINVEQALFEASQQTAYLNLRNLDWKKNYEALVDAAKEAYKLGVFNSDFNYLTLDTEGLRKTADALTNSDAVCQALNVALLTALHLDLVTDKIGYEPAKNPDLSSLDWKQELDDVVSIYDEFKKFELTTLEGFKANEFLQDALNDDNKFDILSNVVTGVVELQLIQKVAIDEAINAVCAQDKVTDLAGNQVEEIRSLTKVDWASDVKQYLHAVKDALSFLDFSESLVPKVDYFNIEKEALENVTEDLFNTESFEKILNIGVNVALSTDKAKELMGEYNVTIDTSKINWKNDFTNVILGYCEFKKLGFTSISEITDNYVETLKSIYADDEKVASLENALSYVVNTDVFVMVGAPVAEAVVNTKVFKEKFVELVNVLNFKDLTKEQWAADVHNLVAAGKEIYTLTDFNFSADVVKSLDLSDPIPYQNLIDNLFALNLLGADQTKNDLVYAVVCHYNLINEEDQATLDLSNVSWSENGSFSEVEMLKSLVAAICDMQAFDGFDVLNNQYDYNKLLENDDFLDLVVDTLDTVVDSVLISDLFPGIINKYLLPQIEKFDDEDATLKDLSQNLTSEELISEVTKLIDALRAAVELNVLKVPTEGVTAIDFSNTDAMKTIVNGILDCKIIEGYESPILRIIFKATKIFTDLERGCFDGIDFDAEQAKLIGAIDSFAVVSKDDKFLQFDEQGRLILDTKYYTSDETLKAAFDACAYLFGEYTKDGETEGSKIVEVVLPECYDKYIANIIPQDFVELVEITGINEQSGDLLLSDVRHLIHVGKVATDMKVQSYLNDKDYDFTNSLDGINEIIDTVFDMHCIKGNESALVNWAVNYIADKTNVDVHTTVDDFAGVDWEVEVKEIKDVTTDLIEIMKANDITSISAIKDFIANKDYTKQSFLTEDNYELFDTLLNDILDLQTIDVLLPFALDFALNKVKDMGIDLTYLTEDYTKDEAVEDIKSLIEIGHIAIDDVKLLDYYRNNWTGDLPELDNVFAMLDKVFELNIVDGKEVRVLESLINKFLPKNDYVAAEDIDYSSVVFDDEWTVIKATVEKAYDFFALNNISKLEDAISFVKDKWYLKTDLVNEENVNLAADVLDTIKDSVLLAQAVKVAVSNVVRLDKVTPYGDYTCVDNLTIADYQADLGTIAEVVRLLVAANILDYYFTKDLNPLDYEGFAVALEKLGSLKALEVCGDDIASEGLNYVFDNKINKSNRNIRAKVGNKTFGPEDFADINWQEEMNCLAAVVRAFGEMANANNADSLVDVINFFKNKGLNDESIYTQQNADYAFRVVEKALDSKILLACAAPLLDFALTKVNIKDVDLSFLKGKLTGQMLIDDLRTAIDIAHDLADLGLFEYLGTKKIENFDPKYIESAFDKALDLNIIGVDKASWTSIAVNQIATLLKVDGINVTREDFATVDYVTEDAILRNIVSGLVEVIKSQNITSTDVLKEYIDNKYYQDGDAITRALTAVAPVLANVSESQIVSAISDDLVDMIFAQVDKKTTDFDFIKASYTGDMLLEDLGVLAEMIPTLVDSNVVYFVFKDNSEVIDYNALSETVKYLDDLNLVTCENAELLAYLVNKGLTAAKVDATVTAETFADVNWSNDVEVLANVVLAVGDLAAQLNVNTYDDFKAYLDSKQYVTKDEDVYCMTEIVRQLTDLTLVEALVPTMVDFGTDKLADKDIDISFLKDASTAGILSDVADLCDIVDSLATTVVSFVTEKDFTLDFDAYDEALAQVQYLYLYNNFGAEIAYAINRKVFAKLIDVDANLSVEDFDFITYWKQEINTLRDVLRAVQVIAEGNNIVTLSDAKNFASDKGYNTEYFKSKENIINVVNAVEKLANSGVLSVSMHLGHIYAIDKLAEKDIDISDTLVERSLLVEDVKVLCAFARATMNYNVDGFAFRNEILDDVYYDDFYAGLEGVLSLNMLSNGNARTQMVNLLLEKVVKIDYRLDTIDWDTEIPAIMTLYGDAHDARLVFELGTLQDIKDIAKNYKGYLEKSKYTEYAGALGNLLADASKLELVEKLALPLSEKYLDKESMQGIADLHNIYNNGSEVCADLLKLGNTLLVLEDLNISGIMLSNNVIPWSDTESVNEIITNILTLAYFNNDGNLKAFIEKVAKVDMSDINFDNLDLTGDAAKLCDMYNELEYALGDDSFFVQFVRDFKNMRVNVKYWTQESFMEHYKNALNDLLDTTIVKETDGAILLVIIVPILKTNFNDIYEALELDSANATELGEDFNSVCDIVKLALDTDLNAIANGKYFTDEAYDLIDTTIDKLSNLNILAGHGTALANAIAARLDGKKVNGVVFEADSYDFDVDHKENADVLREIIAEVYGFAQRHNIKTKDDIQTFVKTLNGQARTDLEDEVDTLGRVLVLVKQLTILEKNGLSIYNLVSDKFLNKVDAELKDLSFYADSSELWADFCNLIDVYNDIVDFGIVDILDKQAIDYNQAELVKDILNKLADTVYIQVKFADLVNFADNKLANVNLEEMGIANLDVATDFTILGNLYEQLIPVLTDDVFPYKTIEDFKRTSFVKSDLNKLIYDYQLVYASCIETYSQLSIATDLTRYITNKVSEKQSNEVVKSVLDLSELTDEEVLSDVESLAVILRDLQKTDLLNYFLFKIDVSLYDEETVAKLVTDVLNTNVMNHNFNTLLSKALDKYDITVEDAELDTITLADEKDVIVELVKEVVLFCNSNENTNSIKSALDFFKQLPKDMKNDFNEAGNLFKNKNYNQGIKQACETIKQFIKDSDMEYVVEMIETIATSNMVATIAIPAYNKLVVSKLSGMNVTVYTLHDYSKANFVKDIALIASATRNAYISGIQSAFTEGSLPGEECIPFLQDAVLALCDLDLLEIKKQDVGPVMQEVLTRTGLSAQINKLAGKDIDFSKYTLKSVSFSADKYILSDMVPYVYKVLEGFKECGGYDLPFLGNTSAVKALVEIYDLGTTTTLSNVLAPKVVNVLSKLASKAKVTMNTNTDEVLANISVMANALIDMGVFSNNGIVFNNNTVNDTFKEAFDNTVYLTGNIAKLENAIYKRINRFDTIPFSWEGLTIKTESKSIGKAINSALKLMKNYNVKSVYSACDLFTNPAAQADLRTIVDQLGDSKIVEQVGMPLVKNVYKLDTVSHTDGVMVYDGNFKEFCNEVLDLLFAIMPDVKAATNFQTSNLKNNLLPHLANVANIFNTLGASELVQNNAAKVIVVFFNKYAKYSLNDTEKAEFIAIDVEAELGYFADMFNKLAEVYATTPFNSVKDVEQNPAVLEGVADALAMIKDANIIKFYGKGIAKLVNDKVIKKSMAIAYDFLAERLADDTYTADKFVADYASGCDALKALAQSKVLKDMEYFDDWNIPALRNAIDVIFDMNLVVGHEQGIIDIMMDKTPALGDFYNDTMVIPSWKAEMLAIVDALQGLQNDGINSLNGITSDLIDTLSDTTISAMLKSTILATIVTDKVNETLDDNGFDYVATIEELRAVTDWGKELQAIKDAKSLKKMVDDGDPDKAEVVAKYNSIMETTFVKKIVNANAKQLVENMPFVDVDVDTCGVTDWAAELSAIVDAIDTLNEYSIDSLTTPTQNLNGTIIYALLSSKVLAKEFTNKYNEELEAKNFSYRLTDEDLAQVDSAAKWDVELAEFNAVEELVEDINNGTATRAQIKAEYDKANANSIIAAHILNAALEDAGIDTTTL